MSRETFELIECACGQSYVRSTKRGTCWDCPGCGEMDDWDNLMQVEGPARLLTATEADTLLGHKMHATLEEMGKS